ncbi:uncharacterized protein [Notamacropus eugenii]|uniref:uncharacterized protein isoform X2 n=1 Tax=Notamacropus eugenii TaxID=9315 RepID=UPI003B6806A4
MFPTAADHQTEMYGNGEQVLFGSKNPGLGAGGLGLPALSLPYLTHKGQGKRTAVAPTPESRKEDSEEYTNPAVSLEERTNSCPVELGTARLRSTEMVTEICLMLFIMFGMTQPMSVKKPVQCKVGQYEVDGMCCYPCHADLGFVTRQECSSTSNTVCGCSPGYFCADLKDDDCELCIPHQVCTPGQYVKSPGTERSNTICEKCQAGTFSPKGTLSQCLPWTNCTAQGSSEEKPGTDTTDALCSPQTYSIERREKPSIETEGFHTPYFRRDVDKRGRWPKW